MPRAIGLVLFLAGLAGGCPLPEMGGEGQECFDPPDQCQGGLTCVGGVCIRPECTRTEDCSPGNYCDLESFQCRTGCDDNQQCQPGFYCDLSIHECARDPDAPARLGEPCHFTTEFGVAHPEANACETDLICIGYVTEGSAGYCPGGADEECWIVREVFNRTCVDGICSGSVCCAFCAAGSCPDGYDPIELNSGECACLPVPVSANCNPLDNDCPSGEKCIPSSGLDTRCIPIGYAGPGQSCDWYNDLVCQEEYLCLGTSDVYTCKKMCDQNDSSTCEPGSYCAPINGVDRWGSCKLEAK